MKDLGIDLQIGGFGGFCFLFLFGFAFILPSFSEISGSVVWCLKLIWVNSQQLLLQILLCFFLSFPSGILIMHIYFVVVPQSLDILLAFFFFSLFSFQSFYRHTLKLRDSFLSDIQSIKEPRRHSSFLLQYFPSLAFTFYSFLEFTSLCSCYPSVLAYYLLFPLKSSASS